MRRSEEAKAWRHLYRTRAWKALRANQLNLKPLCEWCANQNRIVPATICDHVIPHKGDEARFYDADNLASLCKPHHDSAAQVKDHQGYTGACDATGWPTDPRHPNRG